MKKNSSFNKKVRIDSIEKQLITYSLAAVAILAGTKDARAGIVYTDVIPDAVLNTHADEFPINFLGTTTDFIIKMQKPYTNGTHWSNTVYVNPSGNNSFKSLGGWPDARAMNAGSVISGTNSFTTGFWKLNHNMAFLKKDGDWTYSGGQFIGTNDKYLGLKFKVEGKTYYGWAQVQVASDVTVAKVTEYAYEDTPGLGIKAGEKDVSLPVSISEIQAVQGITGVRLSWSMEASQDFLGFIIERQSLDNHGEKVSEWEGIASYKTHSELKANNNQSSRQTYVFKDPGAVSDMRYQYRLSEVNLSGQIVSQKIIEARAVSVPIEFALDQNYPNPFNPLTKIQFGLPKKSKVTLTIYNLKGQIIDVIVNKTMDAGYHSVNYDASLLSSGVYLYEVKNGSERLIKKMQVIK